MPIQHPAAPAVGAHNSVVGADHGLLAPSWDQESVRDSVHEGSASARIAAGQRPRPSFRHPHASSRLGSVSVSSGRSTCRRSTVSWWRNTMISRSLERPERTVSRASDARNRYKIRYTRTQHRPASRQVNDHGRVSGTHSIANSVSSSRMRPLLKHSQRVTGTVSVAVDHRLESGHRRPARNDRTALAAAGAGELPGSMTLRR